MTEERKRSLSVQPQKIVPTVVKGSVTLPRIEETKKGKRECHSCKKSIQGEANEGYGKYWHPEHFICHHCKNKITGAFKLKDDHLYCKRDYLELFAEKCYQCKLPIDGEALYALDQYWHTHHFLCARCNQKLVNGEIFAQEDRAYCKTCYNEHIAPFCHQCKNRIVDEFILNALGKTWHKECFRCNNCQDIISSSSFFVSKNQMPLCNRCRI